ncbi:PHP domain-containing protein [Erwinia amylovora]|uniref:RNase RNM n=1 Tax=Erwinia amylovora TaxID=552 RepID=UPI0020C054F9|nr:PHP domain-containing protein [Erwinia amylovora]MCK8340128.1 PHP domain-containing protein [Erwinia amylovora]
MTAVASPVSAFPVYDLHSHTRASDGLLTPEQLVLRAVQQRVGVLAITDHDTTDGIAPAREAMMRHQLPLRLVDAVEISTLWENHEIHIVGLGIDIAHPQMVALLAAQAERRLARARLIAGRLEKAHIPGALDGALALAEGGAVTRGHFARFLIAAGKADNMQQVFKNYLARGKTGYVPPQWCTIKQAIDAIHQSGGRSVVAHPGRYGLSAKWLKRLLAHFSEQGGEAMEVAQCQQAPNERQQLARYAQDYQLAASQGSDFHQACPWIELGKKLWLPGGVEAVWQRFPDILTSVLSQEIQARGE